MCPKIYSRRKPGICMKCMIYLPLWFWNFKVSGLFLSNIDVCRKLADTEVANRSSAWRLRQDLILHGFWCLNTFEVYSTRSLFIIRQKPASYIPKHFGNGSNVQGHWISCWWYTHEYIYLKRIFYWPISALVYNPAIGNLGKRI